MLKDGEYIEARRLSSDINEMVEEIKRLRAEVNQYKRYFEETESFFKNLALSLPICGYTHVSPYSFIEDDEVPIHAHTHVCVKPHGHEYDRHQMVGFRYAVKDFVDEATRPRNSDDIEKQWDAAHAEGKRCGSFNCHACWR